MNRYWVSAIVQNEEDKRAWLSSKYESVHSMEEAMRAIKFARENFTVLSAWIDIFDDTGVKRTIFHECYVNVLGMVK